MYIHLRKKEISMPRLPWKEKQNRIHRFRLYTVWLGVGERDDFEYFYMMQNLKEMNS